MAQHTTDLFTVEEGDTVRLTTTKGDTLEVECTNKNMNQADSRSGEIRETTSWEFDGELYASILDGLKSSTDDPDFPIYYELRNMEMGNGLGYITNVNKVEDE